MTPKKSLQPISETQLIQTPTSVASPIQDEATALISQAINKGVDVATMEKLLAMRRELNAEKAKAAYDTAMADFQAECPTIEKKTQGYNYKYADLTTIIEQVKDLLARHGFSYTFDTDEVDNAIIVYCKVKHIAGHMEISKAQIKRETTTKMNASQQSGAAMTYGKRYAFVNAFGILTGDEDTDASIKHMDALDSRTSQGGGVVSPGSETANVVNKYPKPGEGSRKPITASQKGDIIRLLGKLKKTQIDLNNLVKAQYSLETYQLLTITQANEVIKFLEKKIVENDEKTLDLDAEQIAVDVEEGLEEDKSPKMSMTEPI